MGLVSSQRSLEKSGPGVGTLARPEIGRKSWSLFLYPKQPEFLISQKWPLNDSWDGDGRGGELEVGNDIDSEATDIKTKAI